MTARLPIIIDAGTLAPSPYPPDVVPALIAAAGGRAPRTLSLGNFAHPFDWKIKGGRLVFNPPPRFIVRGAELHRGCASRETSVRVGDSTFADKSANKFVSAEWLDPSQDVAVKRFHEATTINNQFITSLDIDGMRSCPASAPRTPCGMEMM